MKKQCLEAQEGEYEYREMAQGLAVAIYCGESTDTNAEKSDKARR